MTNARLGCTCAAAPSPWVRRFLPIARPGGRALDIAAGEGRHTAFLLLCGFRVTAVDVDTTFLEPLSGTEGLTIETRDLEAEAWPYGPEVFDLIVVTNYLHRAHYPHYWASLAPGGLFLTETFLQKNREIWGRPANPAHGLREGELLELLPAAAQLVAYEEGLADGRRLLARAAWVKPGVEPVLGHPLGAA